MNGELINSKGYRYKESNGVHVNDYRGQFYDYDDLQQIDKDLLEYIKTGKKNRLDIGKRFGITSVNIDAALNRITNIYGFPVWEDKSEVGLLCQ